jgi:predicted DNA-binding transcriptional regulator YafY
MTAHPFAGAETITRRYPSSGDCVQSRVVRVAWILTRLLRRDPVRFQSYQERFGASLRSFCRDIATLRDAGVYIEAENGAYRYICFRPEREAV